MADIRDNIADAAKQKANDYIAAHNTRYADDIAAAKDAANTTANAVAAESVKRQGSHGWEPIATDGTQPFGPDAKPEVTGWGAYNSGKS